MSRHLTQIDPNAFVPVSHSAGSLTSPTSTEDDDDQQLSSPSKENPKPDRMREWTFPRRSAREQHPTSTAATAHGRSSSIVGSGVGDAHAATTRHEPTLTKDLRHRPNFSLAHPPQTPDLSIPLGSAKPQHASNPSRYSTTPAHRTLTAASSSSSTWRARKRWHDLLYFVVFGVALVLFASSLFGVGYEAPRSVLPSVTRASGTARTDLEHVEIANGFRPTPESAPHEADDDDEVLRQVHNREVGDTSHDPRPDHFHSSPDSNAAEHREGELFQQHGESAADLDQDDSSRRRGDENRPRPARLPLVADDDHLVRHDHHHHEGHEEEHEYLEDEDDQDDDDDHDEREDEHASHDHDSLEDEDEELVDDSISISTRPGHLDPADDPEQAASASLSALEELLLDAHDEDADDLEAEELSFEEREAQHLALQHRRPPSGQGLEQLRRDREELGRIARELRDEDEDVEIDIEDWRTLGQGELRRDRKRRMRRIR
ncbi:uncharacterized protein JCM15063_001663 [Sporobolomyces koalae]|uniref:uncharacterized protein n=1 Tax=Sporobolomyces koalae TaxID=500713 RepID=UPI00316DB6C1